MSEASLKLLHNQQKIEQEEERKKKAAEKLAAEKRERERKQDEQRKHHNSASADEGSSSSKKVRLSKLERALKMHKSYLMVLQLKDMTEAINTMSRTMREQAKTQLATNKLLQSMVLNQQKM